MCSQARQLRTDFSNASRVGKTILIVELPARSWSTCTRGLRPRRSEIPQQRDSRRPVVRATLTGANFCRRGHAPSDRRRRRSFAARRAAT
jgi:hypothetical protein